MQIKISIDPIIVNDTVITSDTLRKIAGNNGIKMFRVFKDNGDELSIDDFPYTGNITIIPLQYFIPDGFSLLYK